MVSPSDILKLYTQAQNFWADPINTGDTNYSNFAQMLTRISLQAKIAKFIKKFGINLEILCLPIIQKMKWLLLIRAEL